MEIKCNDETDGVSVELSGELDEYSAEYVRISLDDLIDKFSSGKKLILDFSIPSFISSKKISILSELLNFDALLECFFVFSLPVVLIGF